MNKAVIRNLLRPLIFTAMMLAIPFGTSLAATASSVSQWGITWTFDRAYEVGQYANGDYWVVGPVTITEISPRSVQVGARVMNGTQVNPNSAKHGYDSVPAEGGNNYVESLNVAPSRTGKPLTLSTGSVVSSISLESPKDPPRPALKTLAVLTVVRSAPASGAFRPSPYGVDKTSYWNEKSLDYSVLRSLAPVAGTPSLSSVTDSVRRFWNEQDTRWTARTLHASDNQEAYGRDIATESGAALLSLHLNYSNAQKRDLFVYIVQQGLDIYGRASAGADWMGDGGHNHGRKMLLVMAGIALRDPNILDVANARKRLVFQEDTQTFYISQSDVGLTRYTADGRPREAFTAAMIGTPEWGAVHATQPDRDGSNWSLFYRWVGSQMMGHAIAAHLTPGAVAAWNWPAFFDYMDRYEKIGGPDTTGPNATTTFVQNMWNAYRNASATKSTVMQPPTLENVQ